LIFWGRLLGADEDRRLGTGVVLSPLGSKYFHERGECARGFSMNRIAAGDLCCLAQRGL
jgi:hypothetical protein